MPVTAGAELKKTMSTPYTQHPQTQTSLGDRRQDEFLSGLFVLREHAAAMRITDDVVQRTQERVRRSALSGHTHSDSPAAGMVLTYLNFYHCITQKKTPYMLNRFQITNTVTFSSSLIF